MKRHLRTGALCAGLTIVAIAVAVAVGSRSAVTLAVPAATSKPVATPPDIDATLLESMADQGTHMAITVGAAQRTVDEASAAEKAETVARHSLFATESGTLRGVSFGEVTVDDYGVDTYPDATDPKLRAEITKLIEHRDLWAVAYDNVPMPVFGPVARAKERKTVENSTVVILIDPNTMSFVRAETF